MASSSSDESSDDVLSTYPECRKSATSGRTARKRKRKKDLSSQLEQVNISKDHERRIKFGIWLKKSFDYRPHGTKIAQCRDGAGNGVYAKRAFSAGEAIVSVPHNVMIGGGDIFKLSPIANRCHQVATSVSSELTSISSNRVDDDHMRMTSVQLMCLFLIEQRRRSRDHYVRKQAASHAAYISMLPSTFTHLAYWTHRELSCLSPAQLDRALRLRRSITQQRKRLNRILRTVRIKSSSSSSKRDNPVTCFGGAVTWKEYRWAWCCVNTRCVFSNHRSAYPAKYDVVWRHSEEDDYYLVPYLDMLNHDESADTQASFNTQRQRFEIVTHRPYKKHDELFIKYGELSNVQLLMDYGYVPDPALPTTPVNPNDAARFDLEEIFETFQIGARARDELGRVASMSGLVEDLAIVARHGPSWSLLLLLTLVINNTHDHTALWGSQSADDLHTFIMESSASTCSFPHHALQRFKKQLAGHVMRCAEVKRDEVEERIDRVTSVSVRHPTSTNLMFLRRYWLTMSNILTSHQNDQTFAPDVLWNQLF